MAPKQLARLQLPTDDVIEGEIVDSDGQQVVVEFGPDAAPPLPLGTRVELSLAPEGKKRPTRSAVRTVGARVVARADNVTSRRYSVRVEPPETMALIGVKNERGAVRVPPSSDQPIMVELRLADESAMVESWVIDLSRTGMGVLIKTADEDELAHVSELELRFSLPDDRDPVVLVGLIRHRSLCGAAIRYGIQFDKAKSGRYEHDEQRMNRYVMRRQMELLRRSRTRAAG